LRPGAGSLRQISSAPPHTTAAELEALRSQYESSLSWRLTRPLRTLKRTLLRTRPAPTEPSQPLPLPLSPGSHDLWLRTFWDDQLAPIDRACVNAGPEAFALFRALDADLWAMLLAQEQEAYPNISSLLPDVPPADLQVMWNGTSGVTLATQSCGFYELLGRLQATHGQRPLGDCRVLDFGCGWGRLTRFLARDVEPGRLYGCDPVAAILELARTSRVPAELARSDFLPERVPFDERFDLAYAFSVFTHLSESAHTASLRALHEAIVPGGLLVLTIRPPEYLRTCELLHPVLAGLGAEPAGRVGDPLYLYAAHDQLPLTFDAEDHELTYGETVVTLAYVRERWSEIFELLDVHLSIGDPHQIVLALRRL
jgi:SAM-dependent methyltransferase